MSLNGCGVYLEIACYVALLFFMVPVRIQDENNLRQLFDEYLTEFNKSYGDSSTYNRRMRHFENSLQTINFLNKNRSSRSANYGLTKFSDMSPEEFRSQYLGQRYFDGKLIPEITENRRSAFALPEKVDWRQKRAITKIKNQNDCGACWAFAVVETVESLNAIRHGELAQLSVQQMIDCSTNNYGCKGGDICSLLSWLKSNNASVVKESEYPLVLRPHKCRWNASLPGVRIDDFVCLSLVGNENLLLTLLATEGPVAVAVNAQTWQNYVGGVIQFHCDGEAASLNHAVQIVGYDLSQNVPHYIVRNSWGDEFGDQGYLYIAIGNNLCGIAHEVATLSVM
ncbi:cathepsin O-like [Cylas formicarius]|uniref:cathepsin O-like n=1 Tax=Cylas formicarius TaxID=197179 RepID=UPI002958C94B|nr:cathepsin O-like [Cylas formicarius]